MFLTFHRSIASRCRSRESGIKVPDALVRTVITTMFWKKNGSNWAETGRETDILVTALCLQNSLLGNDVRDQDGMTDCWAAFLNIEILKIKRRRGLRGITSCTIEKIVV